MPIYHNCEQYSIEWEKLRIGIPTTSQFSKIITPTGKKSEQFRAYAYHLIAEIYMKRPIDTYTSEHMQRGSDLEPEAANYYEMENNVKTKRIGFITDNENHIGCSPDRLVGDDGLIEIKCPKPNTMIQYFIEENIEDKYKPQIQGQLYISERKWVDVVSYHPDLLDTNIIMRVTRDDVYCRLLEKYLDDFRDFMGECLLKFEKKIPGFLEYRPDGIDKLLDETSQPLVGV